MVSEIQAACPQLKQFLLVINIFIRLLSLLPPDLFLVFTFPAAPAACARFSPARSKVCLVTTMLSCVLPGRAAALMAVNHGGKRSARGQGSPVGCKDPVSLSRSNSICLLNRPWLNKLSSPAPLSFNATEKMQTPYHFLS